MYAVTSRPLLNLTRAIFRSAELGFLGVMVLTCRQTPRFCGQASRSLTLLIRGKLRRGFLMSWLIVGISRFVQSVARRSHIGPPPSEIPPRRRCSIDRRQVGAGSIREFGRIE